MHEREPIRPPTVADLATKFAKPGQEGYEDAFFTGIEVNSYYRLKGVEQNTAGQFKVLDELLEGPDAVTNAATLIKYPNAGIKRWTEKEKCTLLLHSSLKSGEALMNEMYEYMTTEELTEDDKTKFTECAQKVSSVAHLIQELSVLHDKLQ